MSTPEAPWPAGTMALTILDRDNTAQERLDEAANRLFELFLAREKDFLPGPGVIIDYPDLISHPHDGFLADPLGYIRRRLAAVDPAGNKVDRVVVLTTHGDVVGTALIREGFRQTAIDMPSGPDHTAAFFKDVAQPSGSGSVLYVEAVNEADPKIRPAFALLLTDRAGTVQGGACGSLAERDGRIYCYLATLTVAEGMPPGTGQWLGARLVDYLRQRGVIRIDVGTQTAAPFYEKIGFHVVHRIVPQLRRRKGPGGEWIDHDLAMLSREI